MDNYSDLFIKEDEEKEDTISVYQHEKEMTRMETVNKRWFISFMIVLVMFFASNLAWMIYENQFQDVVITQENDNAANNYIGNNGDIYNGQADNQDPGEPEW